MRHRSEMAGDSARQIQLMQKSLTEPERSGDSQRNSFKNLLANELQTPTRLQRH